jgi:hypothetical protein
MKTRTHLLIAAGLLAAATVTRADTNYVTNPVVYLAGSTAFAPLDNAALDAWATNNGYSLVATTGNSDVKKAKAALYARTNNPVKKGANYQVSIDYINVHQTGSEAAIESASSAGKVGNIPFLDNAARGLNLADVSTNYPNVNAVSVLTSPVYQKNSQFFPGSKLGGFKAVALTEILPTNSSKGIAIQGYAWSVGTNFPTNALNITQDTAQALLRDGNVPLSFFTGNTNDATNGVWLIGRDVAAGVRVQWQIHTGYGALTPAKQFWVTNNNGSLALALTPTNPVLGIFQPAGNGGFASASLQQANATNILPPNVLVDLNGNGTYTNSPYTGSNYLIQYNAYGNSVGVTNSSGQPALLPLSFNGVAPSEDGVRNGSYTQWSYEHIYVTAKPTNAATVGAAIANAIANQTTAQIKAAVKAPGYFNINDTTVYRNTDGGPVFLKK